MPGDRGHNDALVEVRSSLLRERRCFWTGEPIHRDSLRVVVRSNSPGDRKLMWISLGHSVDGLVQALDLHSGSVPWSADTPNDRGSLTFENKEEGSCFVCGDGVHNTRCYAFQWENKFNGQITRCCHERECAGQFVDKLVSIRERREELSSHIL